MQRVSSYYLPALWACFLFCFLFLFGFRNIEPDSDRDGLVDVLDNCPKFANPKQLDADMDGIGNRCDADLNNDQKLDKEDKRLFKLWLQRQDAVADLNEDGQFDKRDKAVFKALMRQGDLAEGIALEPSFIGAPPPVQAVQLFRLPPDAYRRYNTALAVDYRGVIGLPAVIPLNTRGVTVALNDLGLAPDEKAGDQIYAAYLNYDHAAQRDEVESYLSRSKQFGQDLVYQFSGRSVAGTEEFDPASLLRQSSKFDGQHVSFDAPLITPKDGFPVPQGIDDILVLKGAHLPERSLMIVAPEVIADPTRTFDRCDTDNDGNTGNVNGVWSFKSLMKEMANTPATGVSTQAFIHNWLRHYMVNSTVNTFTAEAPNVASKLFLFPGWDGVNAATLDIDNLPFRLIGIVNRLDLAKTGAYGHAKASGEIRFVFGLTLPACDGISPGQVGVPSTVILEYGDVARQCHSLRNRAQAWIDLSSMTPGSNAYQSALQAITDEVTQANAAPAKHNGSALNQLRSNDFGFFDTSEGDWRMREFTLSASHNLAMTTVKQTPQFQTFRIDSAITGEFVSNNAQAVSCESHNVPLSFDGTAFLGATADTFGNYEFNDAFNATAAWRIPITVPPNPDLCTDATVAGVPTEAGTLRHKFALNTCDGCHITETPTRQHHLDPTNAPPAFLSGFLTGSNEEDIRAPGIVRHFNDLQRRAQFLEDVAVKSCFGAVFLPRTHDPLVIFPLEPPVFRLENLRPDIKQAHFSRQQQLINMTH